MAIVKNKQTRDDVELLFLLAVNKLEHETDLDNVTFASDDVPDPEHIIPRQTDQIEASSLIIEREELHQEHQCQ